MPLIEELPVTGPTRVSHGWAYVPDTGPIPAMAPPGTRKRNRNDAGTTNATATAKQLKAVQQRLESLDKENYKDGVNIPIPARSGANARESKTGKKMTSNVRRILTYQRTFQHYLADEEAGISGGNTSGQTTQTNAQRTDSRRKSNIVVPELTSKPSGRGRRKESETTPRKESTSTTTAPTRGPGRPPKSKVKQEGKEKDKTQDENEDTPMTGTDEATTTITSANTQPSSSSTSTQPQQQSLPPPPPPPKPKPLYDPKLDTHPLLRTLDIPKMPSNRVMQALLSEPPLSYNAARAKSLPEPNDDIGSATATGGGKSNNGILTAKPPRHFCALCGYWGRVKCRKCGEWTCGLMECWRGHEGVCVALGMY